MGKVGSGLCVDFDLGVVIKEIPFRAIGWWSRAMCLCVCDG